MVVSEVELTGGKERALYNAPGDDVRMARWR
jgi:hypothetical protein